MNDKIKTWTWIMNKIINYFPNFDFGPPNLSKQLAHWYLDYMFSKLSSLNPRLTSPLSIIWVHYVLTLQKFWCKILSVLCQMFNVIEIHVIVKHLIYREYYQRNKVVAFQKIARSKWQIFFVFLVLKLNIFIFHINKLISHKSSLLLCKIFPTTLFLIYNNCFVIYWTY